MGTQGEQPELAVPVVIENVGAATPLVQAGGGAATLRNFSVLNRDIPKWGPSEGSQACTEIHRSGKVLGRALAHSTECRDRFMQLYQAETEDEYVMNQ